MSQRLPKLRMNLDFMPSPLPDRPGLLIRDSYQYSGMTLIVPPQLVALLQCFDGERTDLDLRQMLVQLTGDLEVGDLQKHLVDSLSQAGFLEDEVYERLKEERHRAFRESPAREAAHVGAAYPEEPEALRAQFSEYLDSPDLPDVGSRGAALLGIAAPHVSPQGGWQSYQAAYRAIGPQYSRVTSVPAATGPPSESPPAVADKTFVILGTSHYGQPEKFGLTRKAFVTPLGEAVTDAALVDRLARDAETAVTMEDYCHAVEHSIEFQVVFLQYLFGPRIRILPILCGPYIHSIVEGGKPEQDDKVRRFLGALGELAARETDRLFWVLGVDMAHMGRRYGDPFVARADVDGMTAVAARDRGRLERVTEGDAAGFWDQIQENHDDLKWCGAAPIYTFLKAVPQARGKLLRYDQWNIDDESVVSFGAVAFTAG